MKRIKTLICLTVLIGMLLQGEIFADLKVGWAEVDITPDQPVYIAGQARLRVSEEVMDSLTATAMAVESSQGGSFIMVSCDLIAISDVLRERVRGLVRKAVPEVDASSIVLFATHTHTAPIVAYGERYQGDHFSSGVLHEARFSAMPVLEYIEFAAERIADAIKNAWSSRTESGVGFGMGHAVVGRNRLITYSDGRSVLYGNTASADFSHVEGYENHSINILAIYSADKKITGLVVNLYSPAQISELESVLSADFWHETRIELRKRFGADIFILPQIAAAGDQAASSPVDGPERRMRELAGRSLREDVAIRIANAVSEALPYIEREIDWEPQIAHSMEILELPRRNYPRELLEKAKTRWEYGEQEYSKRQTALKNNPDLANDKLWMTETSKVFAEMNGAKVVLNRQELMEAGVKLPIEVHAIRFGDVGFITNPFELYLDYGMRIIARSPAVQTFVVQLAGAGTYLPTVRSIKGGGYGSLPVSNVTGPEGGEILVEKSIGKLLDLWTQTFQISYIPQGLDVDGDIEKLAVLQPIPLGRSRKKAELYLAHSDEYLYVGVYVKDNIHQNVQSGSSIWNGDSIQFSLYSTENPDPLSIGLAYTTAGDIQTYVWQGEYRPGIDSKQYNVIRNDDQRTTFYEYKISLSAIDVIPEDGQEIRFNLVVFNDDTGNGFQNWVELAPGLAGGWNPNFFPILVFSK